jgi:hypothetical protein
VRRKDDKEYLGLVGNNIKIYVKETVYFKGVE